MNFFSTIKEWIDELPILSGREEGDPERIEVGTKVRIIRGRMEGEVGTVVQVTESLTPARFMIDLNNKDDVISLNAQDIMRTSRLGEEVRCTIENESTLEKIRKKLYQFM